MDARLQYDIESYAETGLSGLDNTMGDTERPNCLFTKNGNVT